jgi:hypothetical protein
MGEDEEGSPWSRSVYVWIPRDTSAVTVICEAPHNINDQVSKTPQMYLDQRRRRWRRSAARSLPQRLRSEQMLVIPPARKLRAWLSSAT